MKKETKYFIEQVKQKQYLQKLYKSRLIEFEDYFKYSGKEEMRVKKYREDSKDYSALINSEILDDIEKVKVYKSPRIHNDMSKYKLKKDK